MARGEFGTSGLQKVWPNTLRLPGGCAAGRIMVIPNGIAPAHFPATLTGDTVRARHGLAGKIVIGFTGFLRAWHGLPAVMESLG